MNLRHPAGESGGGLIERVMGVPVLGYVIRMFPQVSETFIANEILALERLGVPLQIFSYRRPQEHVPHECVRRIRSRITYLPDPVSNHLPELFAAQLRVAATEPVRYSAALRHVAGTSLSDRSIEPWKRLLQAGHLAGLVQQSDVQRLHAHFAHGATHLAMLASMLTGLPFSFSAHARDIYNNASPRLLAEKIAAARVVVTCTQANQEYLQSIVPEAEATKVELAYHGVDVEKFSFSPGGHDAATPLILSVGRLVEKKGFDDLLRVCRALSEKGLPYRCEIVGEGPERPKLEMQIRALGLQQIVSLPGACSQEELVERYREASVFVLPCKVLASGDRDGIPNVILEAMACGVPVVSTEVSGIPELVANGDTGLLVPPGNTAELSAAIALLLGDWDLRERLAANACATVRARFDSVAWGRYLAELFGRDQVAAIA